VHLKDSEEHFSGEKGHLQRRFTPVRRRGGTSKRGQGSTAPNEKEVDETFQRGEQGVGELDHLRILTKLRSKALLGKSTHFKEGVNRKKGKRKGKQGEGERNPGKKGGKSPGARPIDTSTPQGQKLSRGRGRKDSWKKERRWRRLGGGRKTSCDRRIRESSGESRRGWQVVERGNWETSGRRGLAGVKKST